MRYAAKPVEANDHLANDIVIGDLVFRLVVLVVGNHIGRHWHTGGSVGCGGLHL
jgi:hypothetical protein